MKFGVSLYSYQAAYRNGKMDLEACLEAMKALPGNVDGVEILAARTGHIPQMPYTGTLSDADQQKWKELLAEYGMKPTCYDSTLCDERGIGNYRKLQRTLNPSKAEYDKQMAWMKDEIDFCADFSFPVMRAPNFFGIFEEVIRDSLQYAIDKNVKICMEIHTPLTIKGDDVMAYAEMIDKTCPGAGGFIPDLGIFSKRLPRPLIRKALAHSGDPALVRLIDETYEARGDIASLTAEINAKTDNNGILELLNEASRSVSENPEDLKNIAKYIHHVHAKFYEVDDNYVEHGIDFEGTLKVLKDIGYEGYFCSEYEGQHMVQPDQLDEVEQVRRQVVMTQNILAKL